MLHRQLQKNIVHTLPYKKMFRHMFLLRNTITRNKILTILVTKEIIQDATKELRGMQKCSCGYIGAIADHLRFNQHCLQDIREEMAPGTDMLDEVLIVKTTLVMWL